MLAMRQSVFAILLVAIVPLLGCSEKKVALLSGLVTVDGTPIENGSISLMPAERNAPTAEAIIAAGKYTLTTLPGAKNVSIHGFQKVGTRRYHEGDPSSPMVDVNEEIVPARYNIQTELKADLKVGPQTLDFALTSS
jgi:hypothetical protein